MQYAFGAIITAPIAADSKLVRGIRMLWPHMSKDIAKIPDAQLFKVMRFMTVLLTAILEPSPTMRFEDQLEAMGQAMQAQMREALPEHTEETA